MMVIECVMVRTDNRGRGVVSGGEESRGGRVAGWFYRGGGSHVCLPSLLVRVCVQHSDPP